MKKLTRLAAAYFSVLLSVTAFAVDGTILINQSNAISGGVTPGDTPGFPVTITQPGSYKLSSNLTVPDANTTAILIQADNVSIDLNGFSIVGPVVCDGLSGNSATKSCTPTGTGIGISSATNIGISISNGTIRGMGSLGVNLGGAAHRIDRVNVIGNGGGGISIVGIITNSNAFANLGTGISFRGVVTGNVASQNGSIGIDGVGIIKNNFLQANNTIGFQLELGIASENSGAGNGTDALIFCPSIAIGNFGILEIITTPINCITLNNTQ